MSEIEKLVRQYYYPQGLHPALGKKKPLIEPKGWPDLAPLMSARIHLEFGPGEVAAAMGVGYARVSLVESGKNVATPNFVERYRDALGKLLHARLMVGKGV